LEDPFVWYSFYLSVRIDQIRVEKVECFCFFSSYYGSRLTIMWKFSHVASF